MKQTGRHLSSIRETKPINPKKRVCSLSIHAIYVLKKKRSHVSTPCFPHSTCLNRSCPDDMDILFQPIFHLHFNSFHLPTLHQKKKRIPPPANCMTLKICAMVKSRVFLEMGKIPPLIGILINPAL